MRQGKKRTVRLATLEVPSPDLQVTFYSRLQSIRGLYLKEALSAALKKVNVPALDAELASFAGPGLLQKVARFGIRGEVIFPVPMILMANPTLLGYYRLLYGLSQKEFYKGQLSSFKRLEDPGTLSQKAAKQLPELCRGLILAGEKLLDGIDKFSIEIVHELQLLTLGPQFRGSRNTSLGQIATRAVFDLIRIALGSYITAVDETSMRVRNDSGREVSIEFASDPDIKITELMTSSGTIRPKVSIEIKGGTDYSNIHNRIGEAEKSHQKARDKGFFEFWTIVGVKMDEAQARIESPTTTHFFQLAAITDPLNQENLRFCEQLGSVIGVQIQSS